MIVDCEVVCQQSVSRKSSVSVDLSDFLGAPLMQAIPSDTPFISLNKGTTLLQIKVDLPGLVPGRFLVDVWIGTHNLETLAYVSKAVSIMIDESPIPNRTFPHHPDHGFMIAPSSCKYQPANDPGNWISGEIVSYASHRSRSD
jgi:hypothetical protein